MSDEERDYSVCLSTPDGKHTPVIAEVQDRELVDIGYVTLQCSSCGQTTGEFHDIDVKRLDW